MTSTPWHHGWADVDRTDPQWFIRFLDVSRARQLEYLRDHAQQYYEGVRSGMSVLDVGCGSGVLLHPLARLVGSSGRVVGVDFSAAMIEEARRRAEGANLPLDFRQGDVRNLEFENDGFDWTMAAVMLQHLPEPVQPLRELARVTKPGGHVLVGEQDWDTLIVNASDREVTRKVTHFFCDMLPNGWIGRQLPGALRQAGFADVNVVGTQAILPWSSWNNPSMGFSELGSRAQQAGAITAEERARWEADLERRAAEGSFFASFTFFRVTGRKP